MPRTYRAASARSQEDPGEVQHRTGAQGPLLEAGQLFQRRGRVYPGRSTQAANALFGLGRGAATGNAGTGADAIAAAAAAGGVGVERVVRGILQYSREMARPTLLASIQIPRRSDIVNGSIIYAKFESMDWIAILL